MTPTIITDYRKDLKHPPGHGYGRNVGTAAKPIWVAERAAPMSSEIVHTTNNPNKGTKFANEAAFLRDSPHVSCGDLIGKDGTIAVILPDDMVAWHSGSAPVAFTNIRSFGTEIHCSVGEKPTQAQLDSLAWRIKQRREKYGITKERIETHRAVALPKGRKSDPEGWSDADFYAWRDGLFEPDWKAEWGPQPYRHEWGIPQIWRSEHAAGRPLGKALTDEMLMIDGRKVVIFEHGAIVWYQDKGKVWR